MNNIEDPNTLLRRIEWAQTGQRCRSTALRWLTFLGAVLAWSCPAVLLVFTDPTPAEAGGNHHVSNMEQSTFGTPADGPQASGFAATTRIAQQFTAGSTGGSLAGIELNLHTAPGQGTLQVSVMEGNGTNPGNSLYDLTNPTTIRRGRQQFKAPVGSTLTAGDSYFVEIRYSSNSGRPKFHVTTSDSQSGGSGWSIANTRLGYSNNWSSAGTDVLKMRVLSTLNEPPSASGGMVDTDENTTYTFT